MKNLKKTVINTLIASIMGILAFIIAFLTNDVNHYVSSAILFTFAIIIYLYNVFFVADRNWLDMRAVFSGIWLGTISVAELRLLAYQESWVAKTWVVFALSFLIFQIGGLLGDIFGFKWVSVVTQKIAALKTKKISFVDDKRDKSNRLFLICVITTLIGFLCFVTNIIIKGFIPCFSSDVYAYINFYTKFHVFAVAATITSGLCYYCIKTQKIGVVKKIILWMCIVYSVILFPIMVVSRGVFVTIALTFTSVVFYLNKRRFIAVVVSIVLIFAVYMCTSQLRNFTNAQLGQLFEASKIEIGLQESPSEETPSIDEEQPNKSKYFTLPPKLSFLYGYLTVGHDNLNQAVKNLEEYTWGTRVIAPFNVILNIDKITEISSSAPEYFIRPYLNTYNFLGVYYYDFHLLGVIVFVFLLAFIAVCIQKSALISNNPFLIMINGVFFQAVFLTFFSNMAALFEFWMFLGLILIFAIVANVNFLKNQAKSNNALGVDS